MLLVGKVSEDAFLYEYPVGWHSMLSFAWHILLSGNMSGAAEARVLTLETQELFSSAGTVCSRRWAVLPVTPQECRLLTGKMSSLARQNEQFSTSNHCSSEK